jgi:hypothetical protein
LSGYDEAIRLNPQFMLAYVNRASIWAACPDAEHRDGARAVASATRACELSSWKQSLAIATLAAASAEAGDFAAAVKWPERALSHPSDDPSKEDGRARLELYRANQPYRFSTGRTSMPLHWLRSKRS